MGHKYAKGMVCSLAQAYRYGGMNKILERMKSASKIIFVGSGERDEQILKYLERVNRKPNYFLQIPDSASVNILSGVSTISVQDIQAFNPQETLLCFPDTHIDLMKYFSERGYICTDFRFMEFPALFNPKIIFEHLDEIVEAFSVLADEESRKTFISILEYRITTEPQRLYVPYWKQYFHPIVRPRKGDVIVDGGAFIGDTMEEFFQVLGGECRIYSFEPEQENYRQLCKLVKARKWDNKVTMVDSGLWNRQGVLNFDPDGSGSRIVAQGANSISVVDLDSFFFKEDFKPTLIKLDVEKAEYAAMEGAHETILKYLPRLQICAYHTPYDLWRIPLTIKSFDLKYQLYLAHHTSNYQETVLYALPPE